MSERKPPLYELHEQRGGRFTEFGGWQMPVEFDGIRTEHEAVREAVGIFDVSHMGQVVVTGPDATELMNRLTTNDVETIAPSEAQYSCITREDGVIIDDTVVYNRPGCEGYLFVPNAGSDTAITDRWGKHARKWGLTVSVENQTTDLGMVAVQGPDAIATVDAKTDESIADLSRFSAVRTDLGDVSSLVARTGYTGEDGVEVIFPASESKSLWNAFSDVQPCGLGARDTLRIEAGLLLSGQDFHPQTEPRTPYEAGLDFVVDLETRFVGRQALRKQRSSGTSQELVGIEVTGRGIARHEYPIIADGEEIGHVTSGTLSPMFDVPIAFGYVDSHYASDGTQVTVEIRDRTEDARIVSHRFLQTRSQGGE